MSTSELFRSVDQANVGVLGYVTSKGRPNALAVTPYVTDGRLAVTSTLALIDKAASLRVDPRVTLTAGGIAISGTATVQVDQSSSFFDRHIRQQEREKYPPARSLLAVPFHRKILSWYVGRVVIWVEPDSMTEQPFNDQATVTGLDQHGQLRTWSVPVPSDMTADLIALPTTVADGLAVLLVHQEDPDMRDLRQLSAHGAVKDGVLKVAKRRGTLEAATTGTLDELKGLRTLARRARANRGRLDSWPRIGPPGS